MPSLISHAAVAVAAGVAFAPRDVPNQFWTLAILCSIIPDADVIGFSFGIPYIISLVTEDFSIPLFLACY